MSNIKKSRELLAELGIKTTYVVAGMKDGQFIILDANRDRLTYTKGKKPASLPLCHSHSQKKYASFDEAFGEILTAM